MLALAAILAAAVAPVVSPAPERVALTLYRAPGRTPRDRMDLKSLGGFALVTETRTIDLPAGAATLRFEGVADGIIPASAIVTGLPGGTVEKNRDAKLLTPLNLIDGTLGREVTIRRTDRLTGKAREERATIVAVPVGNAGGVVMRTPEGIETWRCPGVPEKIAYDGVPPGLSAKPVLSVATSSPRAARVTVTLSYLASGFDWSASYVATLAPAGEQLDLFAWATLANANAQAFPQASVQAVAGRLQRRSDREILAAASMLQLHCFRQGTTTSDLPVIRPYQRPVIEAQDIGEIVVTGMRAPAITVSAPAAPPAPPPPPPPPEDIGDLKLYRLPEAVTVAPNAQKQVALLVRAHVAFEKTYRIVLDPWQQDQVPASIMLRIHDAGQKGVGIPLPSGTTALYQERNGERLLIGLDTIGDTAKGERARVAAGVSRQVIATQSIESERRRIALSNANPFSVSVEVAIGPTGAPEYQKTSSRLERIDGVQTWRTTLAAGATAELAYSIKRDD
jgi:hypothetical protein